MEQEIIFKARNKTIKHGEETLICGIVNVTPDSFSDGGKYNTVEKAVERSMYLIENGASMIDIGGESTRPGSTYVEIQKEIDRVVPVIKKLREKTDCLISIDTWKSDVAKAAVEAGADIVNDITGLIGDPEMGKTIEETKASAILMFNPVIIRPNFKSTKKFPKFGGEGIFTKSEIKNAESEKDIVEVMKFYLNRSLEIAEKSGIPKEKIMLDPGIGFALTKRENLTLIKNTKALHNMGYPVFLGVSRKRFLVNILNSSGIESDPETEEGFKNRDIASAILTAVAATNGVEVVRVHTIEEHKIAQKVADSVRFSDLQEDIDFDGYKN